MMRSIINYFLLLGFSLTIIVAVTGCATPSTSKKTPIANEALVHGTPKTTIENVIQFCQVFQFEILNHGNSFLAARIKDTRFQDGDFVFEVGCTYSAESLNDPRVRVSAEESPDQSGFTIVTVMLDGRSSVGNCKSSGVLEQAIFRYLGATPIEEKEE